MAEIELLHTGPADAGLRLVLAHGAGAPMDSPFLEAFSIRMAERAIAVSRFEFAYMAARRTEGRKKPPPRAERLMDEYRSAIEQVRNACGKAQRLTIGGKSMGGRVASMIADESRDGGLVTGLVCLGYPFHPPHKPEQLRTAHLQSLRCPALFVQGDRDPFGGKAEVEALVLSPTIRLHWASDGDHDLAPRGASGFTRRGNLDCAADAVAIFMKG